MYSSGSGHGQNYSGSYGQGYNQSYQQPYQQQGYGGYDEYEGYEDYSTYQQGESSKSNYIRPESSEDWEPYRQVISQLYKTHKLKDVMEQMETQYGFKATPRQYKGKIKQWGLDTKYTKTEEYMEMLKTKKKMEKDDPKASTKFTVRGKAVSDASISRFERRAKKRGILPNEEGQEYDEYEDYSNDAAGSSSGAQWSQS